MVALTWHDVEWFMQYFANPTAALLLLLVTAWYAKTTRRILKANEATVNETREMVAETREMAAATRNMADIAQRGYLASLFPRLRIGNINGGSSGEWSETKASIQNIGDHPLDLLAAKAEIGSGDSVETYEETIGLRLLPRRSTTVHMRAKQPDGFRNGRLVVEDIAGQRHEVAIERTPEDR